MKLSDGSFVSATDLTTNKVQLRVIIIDPTVAGIRFEARRPAAKTKCIKCGHVSEHGINNRPSACPACGRIDFEDQAWGITTNTHVPRGTKLVGAQFEPWKDSEGNDQPDSPWTSEDGKTTLAYRTGTITAVKDIIRPAARIEGVALEI